MGRKKGSLNKKTIERLAAQEVQDVPNNEVFDISEEKSNETPEMPLDTGISEKKSNEIPVNKEVEVNLNSETLIDEGFSDEKNDEKSLLEDFFHSQNQKESEIPESEPVSSNLSYLPLEKQLKTLDFLIVSLFKILFKKEISYMNSADIDFLTSLAGEEDINILPSGKYVFYVGLAGYYFSKIFEKK